MKKKIKDIQIGDYVKSWDFDNEKVVRSEVLDIIKHKNDDQCFNLNNKLTVTGSHQVYTKDGYKLTKDLQTGDKLLDSNGKYTRVKSFRLHQLDVPYVHNLKVKINNYFASGILVHNGAGGVLTKAGTWHGKDKVVDPAMSALKASLEQYKESSTLLSEQIAEQTGDITETLDVQRKELSIEGRGLGQRSAIEKRKLTKAIGQTGLATVGGELVEDLERKRELEGETLRVKTEGVELKSAQEKDTLQRDKDTQELSLKASLRSQIASTYSTVSASDDAWTRGSTTENVFSGNMSPDDMIRKYGEGHRGYSHYCVTPNTEVEMWDE